MYFYCHILITTKARGILWQVAMRCYDATMLDYSQLQRYMIFIILFLHLTVVRIMEFINFENLQNRPYFLDLLRLIEHQQIETVEDVQNISDLGPFANILWGILGNTYAQPNNLHQVGMPKKLLSTIFFLILSLTGVVVYQVGVLLRSIGQEQPFLVTGPLVWNDLQLGAKGLFAHYIIYTYELDAIITFGSTSMN
jgi:hypothetical protein